MTEQFNEGLFDAAKEAWVKYKDYLKKRSGIVNDKDQKTIDVLKNIKWAQVPYNSKFDNNELAARQYELEAKKEIDKIEKQYSEEIKSLNSEHPVASRALKGHIVGILATIPLMYVVVTLIERMAERKSWGSAKLLSLMLLGGAGTAIASQVMGLLTGAGLGSLVNKLKNLKKNESLGERILEKLYRLTEEELEQGSEDSEAEGDDTQETSETLKKLRGHLYRFQEAEGESKHPLLKSMGIGAAAGGGIGAIGGRQLARYGAKKTLTGSGQMAKAAGQKAVKAQARAGKSLTNAIDNHTQANMLRSQGKKAQAQVFDKATQNSAKKAIAANKISKGAEKATKVYNKTINAAGRTGLLKGLKGGLKYGAIAGGAGYLGKKAYDHFKNK